MKTLAASSLSVSVVALLATCSGIAAQNLVVNGDFGLGNTGFSTTYVHSTSLLSANTFFITADPSRHHVYGVSYGDHTTGTGLMLAANGNDGIPVSSVWSQTIQVVPNTGYRLSAWVSQWTTYAPCGARLQFAVNGSPQGTMFCVNDVPGTWDHHVVSWDSGASTTALIEILHHDQSSVGDDFAIDDICFESSEPRYTTYGFGCAGSLGVSHLTPLSPPRLGGTLRVEVDHLPLHAAFLYTGLSRATSPLGPLPFPLASFGMPGCNLLASPDVATLVIGSGNRAVYQLAVPWAPSLAGTRLFQQALVFDPLVGNPIGAVTSDAAEATLAVAVLPAGVTPLLAMVQIPAGSFVMGSPAGIGNELPSHPVHISRPFWMCRHEVTQAEYQARVSGNPSSFQGPNRPVEQVTWHDAVTFCTALNLQAIALGVLPPGYVYRLPTEAEWEYCCRAGTDGAYHFGEVATCGMANAGPTCVGLTRDVATYPANAWGLHDMHGNVSEWCLDSWDFSSNYPSGSVTDPLGSSGSERFIRGGSWINPADYSRSAFRDRNNPASVSSNLGFRVVLAPVL